MSELREKHFKDPCTGDCDVARCFIGDGCPCPWASNAPFPSIPQGNSPTMSSARPNRNQCPEFLLHSPWGAMWSAGPIGHQTPMALCSWVGENMNKWGKYGPEQQREKGKASLFTWDYVFSGLGGTRSLLKITNQF